MKQYEFICPSCGSDRLLDVEDNCTVTREVSNIKVVDGNTFADYDETEIGSGETHYECTCGQYFKESTLEELIEHKILKEVKE